MNTRVGTFVVVQALDGLYNYGPAQLEQALVSEEFGTFQTRAEAVNALLREIKARAA